MALAQIDADVAHQRFEPVLLDLIELDFFEQVGAALQIEPEADRTFRQPVRHVIADGGWNRVGHREDYTREQNEGYNDFDPSRDLQHRGLFLVVCRLILGPHFAECAPQHLHLNPFGDLNV